MQKYGKTLKRDRFFPIFCNFAAKFNTAMKYYEVKFTIHGAGELLGDVCDVLSSLAGECGFESFAETADGLNGYVQQELFDRTLLDALISTMPFDGVTTTYSVAEAEDRDWNEQWEQEGFEPIVIGSRCVVHDGRHLPSPTIINAGTLQIEIDARLAFGTGTHETTRMMVSALLDLDLNGKQVLDCGTGTGILSIAALKCGASQAVGYDIDEWSVDNARHNAIINNVEEHFTSVHGDSQIIDSLGTRFDVVLANINRNILLADMPRFVSAMKPCGTLLLSGFYSSDVPCLVDCAAGLGLTLQSKWKDGEWTCLQLLKNVD